MLAQVLAESLQAGPNCHELLNYCPLPLTRAWLCIISWHSPLKFRYVFREKRMKMVDSYPFPGCTG